MLDIYPDTEAGCIEIEGHRVAIHRRWDRQPMIVGEGWGPPLIAILLNPSTADGRKPDQTLSKFTSYAKLWRCGGLIIVNLWTHRARDPADMIAAIRRGEPQDPRADEAIGDALDMVSNDPNTTLLVGWGRRVEDVPGGAQRVAEVVAMVKARGLQMMALAVTHAGHPVHPLYLSLSLRPAPWPRLSNRQLEALAKGESPRDRLPAPAAGERCPRCHGTAPRSDGIPCELCAPAVGSSQ